MEWISVNDRLPYSCQEYLVRFKDEDGKPFHEVGYFDGFRFNTAYNMHGEDLSIESATHWAFIPPLAPSQKD